MNWETVSYTVRVPGRVAWETDLATYEDAQRSCRYANEHVSAGHRIYAEQEWVGRGEGAHGTRTVDRGTA